MRLSAGVANGGFRFNGKKKIWVHKFLIIILSDQCDQIGQFIGLWATFQRNEEGNSLKDKPSAQLNASS